MLKLLERYTNPQEFLDSPMVLTWSLETLDLLIQGNSECKSMMSGRLLSLLLDVSVL